MEKIRYQIEYIVAKGLWQYSRTKALKSYKDADSTIKALRRLEHSRGNEVLSAVLRIRSIAAERAEA